MPGDLLITNCRPFDLPEGKEPVSLLIERGVIVQGGELPDGAASEHTLDAGGRTVVPGFIDVHLQGAGGADVLDATPEALATVAKTAARFGTTSFLATTVFDANGENRHLKTAAACTGKDLGGATILGIHIEGPFISSAKKGMIQPGDICAPSSKTLGEIRKRTGDTLRMMTIAPELDGGLDIVRALTKSGAVASFGHSSATYKETLKGFEAGISHVTHLYNAMPPIHHREPGPLLAIFQTPGVTAQVIADGVHLHPALVRYTFELIGDERFVAITDGMLAKGLPDGTYTYNGVEYESKNGTPRYRDGTLIGTSLGMSEMLRRMMAFTYCTPAQAVKAASENPARVLGIEQSKGSIDIGKDADLVVLGEDRSVWATIVGGKVVYRK